MNIDLSHLTDGFSSKLKIISYYLAIIKINNLKKILFIYEKKNNEAPYLFTDLCLIKNFKIIKIKKKPKTEILFNPYNYSLELKKLKKQYSITKKKNKKFSLLSELCYKYFIPNDKTQKKIDNINLPKNFIAVHVRSTDRVVSIKNFIVKIQFHEMIFDLQIKNMLNKINNAIKNYTKLNNIFISSDDKFYKNKFIFELKKKYNVYFNKSKFQTTKLRQTRGIDFITELFCLSRSKIVISSVGGGVVQAAYLISGRKIKIYKWINIINLFFF